MHYLIGTAGHPNVGDELITRTWLRELAERDPDTDVWLDCPNPSGAQALLAAEHPRLRCVDTLFRLCWEAPSDGPWDVAAFVASALDDHGLAPRWIPGLRTFAAATSVHLLGGGYVNAIWSRHVGLLAAVGWAARRGVRTAVTGQGLAPMEPETGLLVRRLLADVDVVDVRDTASAVLVGRPEALSGDDLWMADLPSLVDTARARELDAVVCVQGDLLDVSGDWLTSACLEQLRSWDADPARTAVVECIPRVDRAVFDRLRHLVPGLQFVSWLDVVERGLPAADHQRWFSSRFHPHMIAARTGARGIAVPVRPGYYDVKHSSLLEVGTGWDVLTPAGVLPADPRSTAELAVNAERIRVRKDAIAELLYGAPALSAVPVPRPRAEEQVRVAVPGPHGTAELSVG